MPKMNINRLGILTSGGDAPGMNAAIRAVVRASIYYQIEPVAIYEGYKGLLEKRFRVMNARSVANIINQGGTCLKSSRCLEFYNYEGRKQAYNNAKQFGLDALVVIGGDGSFTGAMLLEKEFGLPCIGIPGTIDNDITGTDFTIGYDTALNTVVDAIDKIRDTATSHNRLFFIEVMGKDSGFIALNSGIAAGAEEILIPEDQKTIEEFMADLQKSGRAGKTSSIIVVAEGEKTGSVMELAKIVEDKFPHYEVKVTILGHIQRGGKPSCFDRVLASRLGVAAIEILRNNISGVMVGICNQKIKTLPIEEAIATKPSVDMNLMRVAELITV